ncbi:MAG: hypothetical protein ABUS79_08710, partial [Pseudomonadota bacterium]
LSKGMETNTVPIPVELSPQVWAAIVPTLADSDGEHGRKTDENAQWAYGDPMSQSLNHVRGVALRSAIDYGLWLNRKAESKSPPAELRTALDKSVVDPSTAVRAVYGDRIAALIHMDADWCKRNVRSMFRHDDKRDPAWHTYLDYEHLNLEAFRLLRWRYKDAIERWRTRAPVTDRDDLSAKHIARDLARLYWHGEIGFGDRDNLLRRFFDNAPESIAGSFIEQIGHWLHQDDQAPEEVLVRLRDLWSRRVDVAATAERAAFSWWFSSGRFEEQWAIENLRTALAPGVSPQYAPHFGERLADMIEGHLDTVLSCLDLIVQAHHHVGDIPEWSNAARAILQAAVASGDVQLNARADTIVSRLRADGYHDFVDIRSKR